MLVAGIQALVLVRAAFCGKTVGFGPLSKKWCHTYPPLYRVTQCHITCGIALNIKLEVHQCVYAQQSYFSRVHSNNRVSDTQHLDLSNS